MPEMLVCWGVAFDLMFSRGSIRDTCKCFGMPYPERLSIIRFTDNYVVGYTFLPVIHCMDEQNVKVLETWRPTWHSERIKNND